MGLGVTTGAFPMPMAGCSHSRFFRATVEIERFALLAAIFGNRSPPPKQI